MVYSQTFGHHFFVKFVLFGMIQILGTDFDISEVTKSHPEGDNDIEYSIGRFQ